MRNRFFTIMKKIVLAGVIFAVFMLFVSLLIALLITVSHACFLAVR